MQAHDGPNSLSTSLAKSCGNLGSFSRTSSSNSLYIYFKTDGSFTYTGFKADITIL